MLRNFGILLLVVIGSAVVWTLAIGLLIACTDTASQGFGTDTAVRMIAAAIAVVGLLSFYIAGLAYVRISKDRSLVAAAVAGLCLAIILSALVLMMPRSTGNSLDPPLQPDDVLRQSVHVCVVWFVSVCLSVLGGWVAGRRRPAQAIGPADVEPKADSSLRSE